MAVELCLLELLVYFFLLLYLLFGILKQRLFLLVELLLQVLVHGDLVLEDLHLRRKGISLLVEGVR